MATREAAKAGHDAALQRKASNGVEADLLVPTATDPSAETPEASLFKPPGREPMPMNIADGEAGGWSWPATCVGAAKRRARPSGAKRVRNRAAPEETLLPHRPLHPTPVMRRAKQSSGSVLCMLLLDAASVLREDTRVPSAPASGPQRAVATSHRCSGRSTRPRARQLPATRRTVMAAARHEH